MGTSGSPEGSAQRRSPEAVEAMDNAQLRQLVASLSKEVSSLRDTLTETGDLSVRLREANEHLVLASMSAENRRDEAEEANRRQNEFLAMLAHELRNPLAPIGMAGTLLERIPDASPQLQNLQRVISRQVEQMSRLLDDLLDAARISSGKITMTLEPVLLSDLVERAAETVAPRMSERMQVFVVDIPAHPIVIHGSRVRLIQVFSNLLANASKYTHNSGQIVLSARQDGDKVRIALQDNGIGMSPDILPHIFDLFTQGPRALARSEGGLGVGLNVVRNVVHLHGGEVSATSLGMGEGSEFVVVLPVSSDGKLLQQPVLPVPEQTETPCRLLLIEDNVDACNTLHAFLAGCGHSVRSVYNGLDGLEAALGERYDVIICDIGLPGLDGYELVRRLRKMGSGARPFAIALTGYGQPEDRQQAEDAGFDAFLVKPVDTASLLALLRRMATL